MSETCPEDVQDAISNIMTFKIKEEYTDIQELKDQINLLLDQAQTVAKHIKECKTNYEEPTDAVTGGKSRRRNRRNRRNRKSRRRN